MTDTDTPAPTPPVNPYDAARNVLDRLEAADVPCPTIEIRFHSCPDELVDRVVRALPDYHWKAQQVWIEGGQQRHPRIALFIPTKSRALDDPTTLHARALLAKAQS